MRFVRNFHATTRADGAAKTVDLSPRAADGGIDVVVKMRDVGRVTDVLRVAGRADGERLTLTVFDGAGTVVYEHEVTR